MNWLFGGGTGKREGTTTQSQQLRLEHIQRLRERVERLTEVQAQTLFDAPCPLRDNRVLNIRISLPPTFPNTPPVLTVIPRVSHPWVSPEGQIRGHDKLRAWTTRTDLGLVVEEITREFYNNPPHAMGNSYQAPTGNPYQQQAPYSAPGARQTGPPPPSTAGYANPYGPPSQQPYGGGAANPYGTTTPYGPTSGYPGGPPPTGGYPSNGPPGGPPTGGYPSGQGNVAPVAQPGPSPAPVPQRTSFGETMLPTIPSSFPVLESMTSAQLEELLNDEARFVDVLESLDQVRSFKSIRLELKEKNEELAKTNLAREADLIKAKEELAAARAELAAQESVFQEKHQQQQEVLRKFSPAALAAKLAAAADEADKESDAVRDQFLDGNIDHTTFVKQYLEKKKLFHLRMAKKARLESTAMEHRMS